jgi:hypothetical protein
MKAAKRRRTSPTPSDLPGTLAAAIAVRFAQAGPADPRLLYTQEVVHVAARRGELDDFATPDDRPVELRPTTDYAPLQEEWRKRHGKGTVPVVASAKLQPSAIPLEPGEWLPEREQPAPQNRDPFADRTQ